MSDTSTAMRDSNWWEEGQAAKAFEALGKLNRVDLLHIAAWMAETMRGNHLAADKVQELNPAVQNMTVLAESYALKTFHPKETE